MKALVGLPAISLGVTAISDLGYNRHYYVKLHEINLYCRQR